MPRRSLFRRTLLASLSLLFTLAACVSPKADPADAASDPSDDLLTARGKADARFVADAAGPADAGSFSWPKCGTTTFNRDDLYYGYALTAAPDGTVFHAMADGGETYVSRYRPGQPDEPNWAHIGVGAVGVGTLTVDPSGTPYALIISADRKQTQLGRVVGGAPPAIVPIGAPVFSANGPTSLAFTYDGILLQGSLTGVSRVDLATGVRTQISPALQMGELYLVGTRTARGVTYDHGLVELTIDADVTSATYKTIFPFDTLALNRTGMDQSGRTYALIHEMSADKLIRFDASFSSRETLYEYATVPIALGPFVFGRGALRCDILIAGFSFAKIVSGDIPGVP